MIRSPEKISVILYEYPFNERIRTYLRLEHLFRRLGVLVSRDDAIDHHYALTTLFEVMDVGARADLKSDVLKDLDKQKQILNGYRGNPAIAEGVLDEVVGRLDQCFSALNSVPGKAGQSLTIGSWVFAAAWAFLAARVNSTCRHTMLGNMRVAKSDAVT